MGNLDCNFIIAKNFWDYYLVKYKIKKQTKLILNTTPDKIVLDLSYELVNYNRGVIKALFNLVKEKRLNYYLSNNKILIFDKDRETKKELEFDVFSIETIKHLVENHINFQPYEDEYFLLDLDKDLKFIIRKYAISDWEVLKGVVINHEYNLIYPYLKDSFVLDIGAYIGETAIMFIKNGAYKVYSYEPHPILYNLCIENIKINHLDENISVFNFGVGDKEERIRIREDNFYGPGLTFGLNGNLKFKEVEIKILPLAKILQNFERIDVIKMDCEGAEFSALLFCPQKLLSRVKAIILEYHREPTSLKNYLEEAGFLVENKTIEKSNNKTVGILFAVR